MGDIGDIGDDAPSDRAMEKYCSLRSGASFGGIRSDVPDVYLVYPR